MLLKVEEENVKLSFDMKPKCQNNDVGEAPRSSLFLGNVILTKLFTPQRI
jgi:hypothetical protein